ncbi:protein SFI1 homolog isoform X2 [Oryzias melastigma]|uniref:protein SFI1 homolog isoform X2 n=1 Tax=Oryzias melastigma TaxID=30732 RepID=UPI000CF7FBA1|nr:protein SFI1 homolog isoform X2 [Oryzias melastigma]
MQNNSVRNVNAGLRTVKVSGETKQAGKAPNNRRFLYRVGYNWNKGGRLKELRIRHLARKFLNIWKRNTFGQILPQQVRLHYKRGLLKRALKAWKDEWWISRREWIFTVQAECHYRYYLYIWTFRHWRKSASLRKEKKEKAQKAQLSADRQLMHSVWSRWRAFIEVMRMHCQNVDSAVEQKRLSTMHSLWSLWQTRLQKQQDLKMLEKQVLKRRARTSQSKAWLLWKKMHRFALYQRKKEEKANLYAIQRLKRKSMCLWTSYTSFRQTKKISQAVAQHAHRLYLLRKSWHKWINALSIKRRDEIHMEAASLWAVRRTQRRTIALWKAYVMLCRDKAERKDLATRHFQNHLLSAGLQGFSLNVKRKKDHRLNKNMAVQHRQQRLIIKYWRLWNDRVEEAEDRSFQSQTAIAVGKYRAFLLRSRFHHWIGKLVENRRMQKLELDAEVWFAERMLPRCLSSWLEFTQQRRLCKQRKHKAETYNRQRLCTWVFYSWLAKTEQRQEEALSERMAIPYQERCHLLRTWKRWRERTREKVKEAAKQEASRRLHAHRLLHKMMMQWKDNSAEIRERRNRELQLCLRRDMNCLRVSVEKWKKFVQIQRARKSRLKEIHYHHEVKLLKHFFMAWKKHYLQISQIVELSKEHFRQQTHRFLREVFVVWWEKASLLVETRAAERQAEKHFKNVLRLKVFVAWREAAAHAVSKRHQQGEMVSKAQCSINQNRLLRSFRQWRKRTRDARRERASMEKAKRHHNSTTLSKAMGMWKTHQSQLRKKKVMKRQGNLLLRLKLYQTYFELWKTKLQRRRNEAKQTERALWHWSLTLQAKVLSEWRLLASEQRSRRDESVKAAQIYRDQLLREGVACILTYAAHMSDLTTSLTHFHQKQKIQDLHKVVRRCAMRWKQRALSKPPKEKNVQPVKKSVTFCLTERTSIISSDITDHAAEDERDVQHQDLLLPPSAFMIPKNTLGNLSSSDALMPLHQFNSPITSLSSTHPAQASEPDKDASTLTRELLHIQLDMKSFQQSRKQLRAWRKLREVLQSWLQMSGGEDEEKEAVSEELKELEERIDRRSTELEKQKPAMLLYAQRIQQLQSALCASGVSILHESNVEDHRVT